MARVQGLKAVRPALPADARVYAVGGVEPAGVAGWHAAGASGFCIGSALFKPGTTSTAVGEAATAFVFALKPEIGGRPRWAGPTRWQLNRRQASVEAGGAIRKDTFAGQAVCS